MNSLITRRGLILSVPALLLERRSHAQVPMTGAGLAKPASASVALNSNGGNPTFFDTVSTGDFTFTINAGTHIGLIALIARADGANDGAPGLGFTWDPAGANQALTAISGTQMTVASGIRYLQMFGLVNPTPGTSKVLRFNATNSMADNYVTAVAFNNVLQTSVALAFPNGAADGSNSNATLSITSAVGDMAVGLFASSSGNPVAGILGTTIGLDNTARNFFNSFGSDFVTGAATATIGNSNTLRLSGCDVKAG